MADFKVRLYFKNSRPIVKSEIIFIESPGDHIVKWRSVKIKKFLKIQILRMSAILENGGQNKTV